MQQALATVAGIGRAGGRVVSRLRTRLGLRRAGPIGLELSSDALHLVQMEFLPEGPRLRAALSTPYSREREALLDSPRGLREFVQEALRQRPFLGRRVVTCLPAEESRLKLVTYRLREGESDPEAILKLADAWVEGELAEWVVDFVPASTQDYADGERAAVLVVARREVVVRQLERLRGAGLEVQALEIAPVAVRRLVVGLTGRRAEEGDSAQVHGNVIVLQCGLHQSYLTVYSGRRLILARELGFGEDLLVRRLGESLEVEAADARAMLRHYGLAAGSDASPEPEDDPEQEIARATLDILKPVFLDLVEEVDKAVIYTAAQTRGGEVQHVWLLGSPARWPGAAETLNGLLSLPVSVPDPLAVCAGGEGAAQAGSAAAVAQAVAAACALRGDASGG